MADCLECGLVSGFERTLVRKGAERVHHELRHILVREERECGEFEQAVGTHGTLADAERIGHAVLGEGDPDGTIFVTEFRVADSVESPTAFLYSGYCVFHDIFRAVKFGKRESLHDIILVLEFMDVLIVVYTQKVNAEVVFIFQNIFEFRPFVFLTRVDERNHAGC
jgi:hypothetical protein